MRAFDTGLWRSPLGDTWPHRGEDVDQDWWPQATHLVWEAPALVMCASGGGSRDVEPMFRAHLDPLLGDALERWQDRTIANDASTGLEYWFREVQHGFDAIDEPLYQVEWNASGVALLIRETGAAIGNIGLDRAWRRRAQRLESITEDVGRPVVPYRSVGGYNPPTEVPRIEPTSLRCDPDRKTDPWEIRTIDVEPGDVFVLASGIADTGLSATYLATVIEGLFTAKGRLAGAQDLASRLGDAAIRDRPADRRRAAEWNVHSRLALAVVWIDG